MRVVNKSRGKSRLNQVFATIALNAAATSTGNEHNYIFNENTRHNKDIQRLKAMRAGGK